MADAASYTECLAQFEKDRGEPPGVPASKGFPRETAPGEET